MKFVEGRDRTTQIADYIAQASYEDLPDAVTLQAKRIILDTLGITLGASKYKAGKLASEFVESMGGKPEATIIGYHSKNSAVNAAFANGADAIIIFSMGYRPGFNTYADYYQAWAQIARETLDLGIYTG